MNPTIYILAAVAALALTAAAVLRRRNRQQAHTIREQDAVNDAFRAMLERVLDAGGIDPNTWPDGNYRPRHIHNSDIALPGDES